MEGVYYDAASNLIGIKRDFITVDKRKVDQILLHYYDRTQISKAVEELVELTEVLIKSLNKPEDFIRNDLYEEMADVEIMLAQLKEIYKIDLDSLQEMIDMKLDRTIKRIGEERT